MPKPGDAGYGSAPEGSLSEERAKKAALWVEKEVYKLLVEIEHLGNGGSGATVQVTFGQLFNHYQDVSDTLVGIMARAKKRGLIEYEGQGGQMLFQGKHDHVIVTLHKEKSHQWRREYDAGTLGGSDSPASTVSAPPKKLTVKEQYDEEKKKRQSTSPATSVLTAVATPKSVASSAAETPRSVTSSAAATPRTVSSLATPLSTPASVSSYTEASPESVSESKTESHSNSGFLASMMSKLLPSNDASPTAPALEPEKKIAVPPAPPAPVAQSVQQAPVKTAIAADQPSITQSIMSSLSRLLPTHGDASEPLDDGTLNAIKNSARQAKGMSAPASTTSTSQPVVQRQAPTLPAKSVSHAPVVSNTHQAPMIHAALPQRTRDGTRGAVLKTPNSPPKAARPMSVVASHAARSTPSLAVPAKAVPASNGTLKKEQEDWAKKHMSRPVVVASSSGSSAYAKLAAFQDPHDSQVNKHKSVPAQNVAKKTDAFEKAKQSSTLPTGLQKRFAWE